MVSFAIDSLRFDERGLVPVVVQDADGGAVLMVAYMNRESLEKTLATGEAHFWSRSRSELWRKGETSGNVLRVRSLAADCDLDCLLLRVEPAGPACHTGERSCFFQSVQGELPEAELGDLLGRLSRTIRERRRDRPEGSYTAELLDRGLDRVAQKLGEEATEVVIAGVREDLEALAEESADLLYHLLVLWEKAGLSGAAVGSALARRQRGKTPE